MAPVTGLIEKCKVLPTLDKRVIAPISSSSYGIGLIINSWAIDLIAIRI